MRYKGPIFLPSHIYKMLSEPAIKALHLHNTQAIAKYKGTRSATSHDLAPPDDEEPRSTPTEEPPSEDTPSSEPDLANSDQCESFTLDDSNLEYLIDHFSSTFFINMTSIYHLLSILHHRMALSLTGEPMEDLQVLMCMSCRELTVSVTGIGKHELSGLEIVTCPALINTNHGEVVLVMHECAYYG